MVMRRSDAEVLQIMSQILSAIRFLHLRKIVHCDLKVVPRPRAFTRNNFISNLNPVIFDEFVFPPLQPDNVLVTVEDGQVTIKLADWGYAQVCCGFLVGLLASSTPPQLNVGLCRSSATNKAISPAVWEPLTTWRLK